MYALDLDAFAADSPPITQSAVITGTDPSGATLEYIVNFPTWSALGHDNETVTLNWIGIAQVSIAWYDGSNGAGNQINGAIGNIVIDKQLTALSFVAELYQDLLRRAPDLAGVAYWQSKLDQQLLTQTQVAQAFIGSQEYKTRQVQDLYLNILGRPADTGGLQHWVAALAQGQTVEQIDAAIFGSTEYVVAHGIQTPSILVQSYYQAILGRSADTSGVDYWAKQLQAGIAPLVVAEELQTSNEGVEHLIDDIYQSILQADPTASELETWTARLQQGESATDLLVSLLISG